MVSFVKTYASGDAFHNHINGSIFTAFVKAYVAAGKDLMPYIEAVFLDKVAGFTR